MKEFLQLLFGVFFEWNNPFQKDELYFHAGPPKFEFQYSGWYQANILEPYYMNLENESGNFFEANTNLNPGQRKWPHFIDLGSLKPLKVRLKFAL